MVAVSNTSPVSNLAIIGRLHLLQGQFGAVLIPHAVQAELERLPDSEARVSNERALTNGWLRAQEVRNIQLAVALGNDLDRGESEAIALATEVGAGIVLIDERDGRKFARMAGLNVRGILGVLIRAKTMGAINSVRSEIAALRGRAGFFIALRWRDSYWRRPESNRHEHGRRVRGCLRPEQACVGLARGGECAARGADLNA